MSSEEIFIINVVASVCVCCVCAIVRQTNSVKYIYETFINFISCKHASYQRVARCHLRQYVTIHKHYFLFNRV